MWYCCSGGVERCGVRQVTAVYAGFWVERRTEHGVVQALPADAQGFCPKRPSVSGPRNATDCVMFAGNCKRKEDKLVQSFYDTMIAGQRYMLILQGLGFTILIAVCAILIGTVLGCFFALMKVSDRKILKGIANFYTTVLRAIPLATQLMIFYFVIFAPLGMNRLLVAILAYGFNSGAYCTEIFRAGIQGIDKGQTEAGLSLGLNKNQTLFKIILPQAVKAVLPTYTSEFIVLIKETSVASFIAVMDLTKAGDMIRNATYNAWIPLLTCAVIYLILTIGLTKVFGLLEKRMAKSDR